MVFAAFQAKAAEQKLVANAVGAHAVEGLRQIHVGCCRHDTAAAITICDGCVTVVSIIVPLHRKVPMLVGSEL